MRNNRYKFDLTNPHAITVRPITEAESMYAGRIPQEYTAEFFLHYFNWLISYHPEDYYGEFWNGIRQNARNYHNKNIAGEDLTREEVRHNPWHQYFPLSNGLITAKTMLENGYIVFCAGRYRNHYSECVGKPVHYNWAFCEMNDSHQAAARRIATGFNCLYTCAVSVKQLKQLAPFYLKQTHNPDLRATFRFVNETNSVEKVV